MNKPQIPPPAQAVAELLRKLMKQGASELREEGLAALEAAQWLRKAAK